MAEPALDQSRDEDSFWGYTILDIKAVKEDQRIISGVATTPEPDRVGDIVEPMGIEFRNPSPLLWQHRTSEPVGTVTFSQPTKDGMKFQAKLPKIVEPGRLKERVDEAWQSIKHGLVKAVSIGFRALETSYMKETDGLRFIRTEILELSLVTIPANHQATIDQIKAIDLATRVATDPDTDTLAAPGLQVTKSPGATGRVQLLPAKEARAMKPIQEQIATSEATRAAKAALMLEMMNKASEAGVTLDSAQSEEYDTLEQEVADLDAHLRRLYALEKANKSAARPVNGNGSREASESRALVPANGNGAMVIEHEPLPVRNAVRVSVKANVPPGTSFTRYAMALAASKGNRWEAINLARANKHWHDQTPEVEQMLEVDIPVLMKAAVGPGITTDSVWAGPLVTFTVVADEFIELLRPATIVGRIPGLRRVPFNIQMPRTTAGTSMGWVGEQAPKPVSNMAFDTVTLRWAKAAGIVVLTEELVRFSNPSAESVVRADMIAAMAQFLDRQFVDPTVAAVTNVSPASITNGVSAVVATGVTAAAFFTDVRTMMANFFAANLSTAGGVWIMTQTQALALSLIQNTLGQNVFPTITATGGTLLGYPVIASENIPATGGSPADGFPLIFAVPSEIMLADDGQVVIDASNQASVNMDSAPDSPPTGATNLVSLWQMNMVGLRAERWINWLKRRSSAVQYIQNAKYTG